MCKFQVCFGNSMLLVMEIETGSTLSWWWKRCYTLLMATLVMGSLSQTLLPENLWLLRWLLINIWYFRQQDNVLSLNLIFTFYTRKHKGKWRRILAYTTNWISKSWVCCRSSTWCIPQSLCIFRGLVWRHATQALWLLGYGARTLIYGIWDRGLCRHGAHSATSFYFYFNFSRYS